MENTRSTITSTDIKSRTRILPTNKIHEKMISNIWSIMSMLHIFFSEKRKMGALCDSFYEANRILIWNLGKLLYD